MPRPLPPTRTLHTLLLPAWALASLPLTQTLLRPPLEPCPGSLQSGGKTFVLIRQLPLLTPPHKETVLPRPGAWSLRIRVFMTITLNSLSHHRDSFTLQPGPRQGRLQIKPAQHSSFSLSVGSCLHLLSKCRLFMRPFHFGGLFLFSK